MHYYIIIAKFTTYEKVLPYIQLCDEVIAQQYPKMADRENWSKIGSRVIVDDEVSLKSEKKIHTDRSMVCHSCMYCACTHTGVEGKKGRGGGGGDLVLCLGQWLNHAGILALLTLNPQRMHVRVTVVILCVTSGFETTAHALF